MPEATPRPAATVLLLRDGPAGLEVFMIVRHHAIDFASGALVFPGGRVEEADRAVARDMDPKAAALLPFKVAAIRETFEECGVLLAHPRNREALVDATALQRLDAQYRSRLNGGTVEFHAFLQAEDLMPAPDRLIHFAHWITPANQPKRYDTHFFLATAPADQMAVHDGHEAIDSIWIRPEDALAGAEDGRYKLVFATLKNLEKLARSRTVERAMSAARGGRVVTVLPQAARMEGTRRLMRIPAEADYGGSEFIIDLPPAS